MALLDILTFGGVPMEYSVSRGDVGTLLDIQSKNNNTFTLPSLGGSCTYPAQTDVRSGVTFGSIYTGNMTLPATSDVLTGVQYGANSTEYTGTATSGGGSFISIVNE